MENRPDWRTLHIMPYHKFINEYRIVHVKRYIKVESYEHYMRLTYYKPQFNGITFTKILLKYESSTYQN